MRKEVFLPPIPAALPRDIRKKQIMRLTVAGLGPDPAMD